MFFGSPFGWGFSWVWVFHVFVVFFLSNNPSEKFTSFGVVLPSGIFEKSFPRVCSFFHYQAFACFAVKTVGFREYGLITPSEVFTPFGFLWAYEKRATIVLFHYVFYHTELRRVVTTTIGLWLLGSFKCNNTHLVKVSLIFGAYEVTSRFLITKPE